MKAKKNPDSRFSFICICDMTKLFLFLMLSKIHRYLLTYLLNLLTPWCRTLFEKLLVTQPAKK
jgi:hypothetical protein